jgi:hypothetical protein
VFGDSVVIHARGKEHGNLELLGGRQIDLVEADAILGDDLQPWQRFLQNGTSDGVVPAEKGVEVSGQSKHPGLRKRTTLAGDIPALGGHQSMVRAGGVLVGTGGKQDAHGKRRKSAARRIKRAV